MGPLKLFKLEESVVKLGVIFFVSKFDCMGTSGGGWIFETDNSMRKARYNAIFYVKKFLHYINPSPLLDIFFKLYTY